MIVFVLISHERAILVATFIWCYC